MKKKKFYWKKNQQIRATEVRITGKNVEQGIYSFNEALNIASNMELDLILINPKPNPPICIIGDYDKLLYDEKKRQKDLQKKSKSKSTSIKEIRLGPNIGEGDIKHKIKSAIDFLDSGNKVKFVMRFKGRQIQHHERGQLVLLDIAKRLEEYALPESMPKKEGRNLQIQFKPKK